MFVQFIEGPVADPHGLRRRFDQWHEEHPAGTVGWLGTTAGVTDDGTAFIAARFASAEAARENSDRPEQSAWWAETEKLFSGPVSFMDCDDVDVFRGGGSDDAGFVQVIRGKLNDVAAARAQILESIPDDQRPDVLGGVFGALPDGSYTTVVYFTSEADARVGEAADASSGDDPAQQLAPLHDNPPRFLDLKDPWLWSP